MSSAAAAKRRGTWVGFALVVLSTIAIGVVPTSAKLAYEAGSNPLTVITLRSVIAVGFLALGLALFQKSFRIGRIAFAWTIFSGVSYAFLSYGFLGSVAYIPISLAISIYFIHPILVSAIAHLLGRERLTPLKATWALAAFVGLGIVVGPEWKNHDPVGIGLALLAAVAVCGMIFGNAKAQESAGSVLVNFWMTTVTVIIFVVITASSSSWALPKSAIGWGGVMGAGVGLTVGLLAFFAAFRYVGPVRATMMSNIEPLMGIFFAMLVFGEVLTLTQWSGVVLLIGALVLFELPAKPRNDARPLAESH